MNRPTNPRANSIGAVSRIEPPKAVAHLFKIFNILFYFKNIRTLSYLKKLSLKSLDDFFFIFIVQ